MGVAAPGGQAKGVNRMKIVMAVIEQFKLDEVREALALIGVLRLTVSEVKGHGLQRQRSEIYRGTEYATPLLPETKIEVAVSSDMADRAVDVIAAAARSGQMGDGDIFVFDVERSVSIRASEAVAGEAGVSAAV